MTCFTVFGCNHFPHPRTSEPSCSLESWQKGRVCGTFPEKEITVKLLSALILVSSTYFLRIPSQEPVCLQEEAI